MVRKKRGTVSTTTILIIAVVVAGVVGGYFVGYTTGYQKGHRSGYETGYNEAMEANSIVESVRDAVMDYIRENHPDAAVFIGDLEWSGGRVTPPGLIGYETYVFTSAKPTDTIGWTVTIGYPVVYDATYEVTAQYNGITWTGTVHDGAVSETSYESE